MLGLKPLVSMKKQLFFWEALALCNHTKQKQIDLGERLVPRPAHHAVGTEKACLLHATEGPLWHKTAVSQRAKGLAVNDRFSCSLEA